MRKIVFIGLMSVALMLAGCAATKPKPTPETLSALKSKKVAITTFAPEKNIFYMETLYRVLWLEYTNNTVSYDGLWEIEKDLTPLYAEGFQKFGVNATPYFSDTLKSYQSEFTKSYTSAPKVGYSDIEKAVGGPNIDFYKSVTSLKTFPELMKQLQGDHYDYLIELYIPKLFGNAPSFGMVVVGTSATMNLIDVNSNTVLWSGPLPPSSEVYQLGGDLHALEKDNLKLLKEGVTAGIKKTIARDSIKTAIGYPD